MIKIDNYEDYEAVVVGKLSRLGDCTAADILATDPSLPGLVRRYWDLGITYTQATELLRVRF